MKLKYETYFDKIHGCFLGKCAAGNIGAPFEGAKGLFNFEYSPYFLEKMLPNDDLDLQVLWLEAVEKYGIYLSQNDLADYFERNCPYAPGEYAVFKENYRKGIRPPLSGIFNNDFYRQGMGSPIRSEIWACLFPGNPEIAVKFAAMDAELDHHGESVYAEQFLAALEAMAFFESDVRQLIQKALGFIPGDSKMCALIADVMEWCVKYSDFVYVRSKIIAEYGDAEATNVFQNMGIIVMSLLLKTDFLDVVMVNCNSGFDTDCTCATAGAITGLIYGAEAIIKKYGFPEMTYKLGVTAERRSDKIYDLAEDIARMGVYFTGNFNNNLSITGARFDIPQITRTLPFYTFFVKYEDDTPGLCIGGSNRVILKIKNISGAKRTLNAKIESEKYVKIQGELKNIVLLSDEEKAVVLTFSIPADTPRIKEAIKVRIVYDKEEYVFGFTGGRMFKLYGPYWKNVRDVGGLKYNQSYWDFFGNSGDKDKFYDELRHFHLSCLPDEDADKMRAAINGGFHDSRDAADEGKIINMFADTFYLEDYARFNGQARYILHTRFYSGTEKKVMLVAGHSERFKMYLNGEEILASDRSAMFTPENLHKFDAAIKKGLNDLHISLVKISEKTKFRFKILTDGVCSDHDFDYEILNMSKGNA